MTCVFPSAVPELCVRNVALAARYYESCLGFHWGWGAEGLGQVSKGNCRIFLSNDAFRGDTGTPTVIGLNLNSKAEVDALYEVWTKGGAHVIASPESTPWHLYEFTVEDLDGNRLRVFYDFAWELPDRGGRTDDDTARHDSAQRQG